MSTKRDRRIKAHRKACNIRRNNTPRMDKDWENHTRYVLDVRTPDGGWRREPRYTFKTKGDVARYMMLISSIRVSNDQDIIEGRIIDLATSAVMKHIPAYKPKSMETADAS